MLLLPLIVWSIQLCQSRGLYVVKDKSAWSSTTVNPLSSAAAVVNYTPSEAQSGWDTLEITTSATFTDEDQAYAAGFGEGAATYNVTWLMIQNMYEFVMWEPLAPEVSLFVADNWAWTLANVALYASTDVYWHEVGLQVQQFNGLLDGLNSVAPFNQSFSFDMLQGVVLTGDLLDLDPAMNLTSQNWRTMTKDQYTAWFATRTRCSALIKVAYDMSDIFFGHATWSTFNGMLRIYKTYNFNFKTSNAKKLMFSSYPGALTSIDDFYTTDTNLVVIETSLAILNTTMYDGNVVPQSLLYWVRVMVATRLATDAQHWTTVFSRYNSGTYNNQWMVLDLNLFSPGQDLLPNTLWIAEQLPGIVGTFDATGVLQYGYWPSYNIPSIPALYYAAGFGEATITQGWQMNDYQRCVRAQIFRRDQDSVTDIVSFQRIMQYNDYLNDPVSERNPVYAIASRGDLALLPMCFGAIDAKVSSYTLFNSTGSVLAYSGPTPQQPFFNFSSTDASILCSPRLGIPLSFDFSWQTFNSKS